MEHQIKETKVEHFRAVDAHELEDVSYDNLATALSKAQGMMNSAKKDKENTFFKSNYADLASVFDSIRMPFSLYGLSITQTMSVTDSGKTMLCTRLMHSSGEHLNSEMVLPIDGTPQKMGSALTYYRRYALMAIAGVSAEDDDGNEASGKPRPAFITPKQVADLEDLINGNISARNKFMDACKNDMSSITVDRYPGAVKWIKKMLAEG